jgi:oxygen-independent coproporphyrinogen-3 oxidase
VTTEPWGLYIHVPWCRVRCPYCAFYVEPDRDAPWEAWVDRTHALVAERRPAFPGEPATIYLGGGTPSRLPPAALGRLLAPLRHPALAELTAEANPEDLTPAWAEAAHAAGIDRVSLGVQTLHPGHARRLGRAHSAVHAARAAALAATFRSWSLDLMFGLHGQSPGDLEADLDGVLALDPPHVSLYGLTIEPDTGYARGAARGVLTPADDELWRAMYARIVERLAAAGLERYEVSNFARPGHEALHNQGYWSGRPYLGVGPSAHSLWPDGARTVDVADLDRWLYDEPVGEREQPDARQTAIDLLISCVRAARGLDLSWLQARTGQRPSDDAVRRLVRGGLLQDHPTHLRLTDEGFYVVDGVVRALADSLRAVDRGPAPRA